MSANMERDKNETITTKDLEIEEMKRELKGMGMYEPGYSYTHMKAILDVISESKDMAKMNTDNKNAQKELMLSSGDHTLEVMSKTNLSQELEAQEHVEMYRPTCSYGTNQTSPTILDRKSSHNSNSPESMFDIKNSTYRHKNIDANNVLDKLHENLNIRDNYIHGTNRHLSLRSRNSLQDSQSSHVLDVQSDHNQKLDRWRINPFDSCVNETDVPLQQPNRPPTQERIPFRYCKDAETPEKREKVMLELSLHLKEMADLWHNWHCTTNTKFQWGSPIQVGTANDSLDNEPLTDTETEQDKAVYIRRDVPERASKRKATLDISNSLNEDGDDNNSIKQKRVQFPSKTCKTPDVTRKQSGISKEGVFFNKVKDDKTEASYNNNTIINFYSTEMDSPCSKSIKKFKDDDTSSETSQQSTSTSNWPEKQNVNRSLKTITVTSDADKRIDIHMTAGKNDRLVNAGNFTVNLMEDTDDDDDNSTVISDVKIKPSKNLLSRLNEQCTYLKQIEQRKGDKMIAQQEEIRKKEEENRKRREELSKRQLQEIKERYMQEFEAEKMRKEKSAKWNDALNTKTKGKLWKHTPEEKQQEVDMHIIEQSEEAAASLTNKVQCPICSKAFPSDKILDHAAECEQYIISDEENDDITNLSLDDAITITKFTKDSDMLECDVCSSYRTNNGTHYEEHVNRCLQSKYQNQQSASHECENIGLDNIPTSPVRSYVPISKQENSEIDYRAQFSSNAKTQVRPSKKRKR